MLDQKGNEIGAENSLKFEAGCALLKESTADIRRRYSSFFLQLRLSRHQLSQYIASGCMFFSLLARSIPEERSYTSQGNEELALDVHVSSTHISFGAFHSNSGSMVRSARGHQEFQAYENLEFAILTEQGKSPYLTN